jgi:hypothetical protein
MTERHVTASNIVIVLHCSAYMPGSVAAAQLCQDDLTNLDVGPGRATRYNERLLFMPGISVGSTELRVLVVDDDI